MLPVIMMITLLAVVILLLSRQNASSLSIARSEADVMEAAYVAEAGLAHAKWQLSQNNSCASYADIPATSFGNHSYSATVAPNSSSPVTLSAVGTLADGASQTLTRSNVKTYQPLTILTLQPDATAGKDTRLYEWKSAWNFGSAVKLLVADEFPGDWSNALMEFDLSAIPSTAKIVSANLILNQSASAAKAGDFSIHRVTSQWTEGTQTGGNGSPNWTQSDTGVAWTTPGGDFDSTSVSTITVPAALGPNQWEIADLVQDWVSGTSVNYGLAVVPASAGGYVEFSSSDATDPALRPKLEVTYACECGVGGASGSTMLQPAAEGKDTLLIDGGKADSNTGTGKQLWIANSGSFHHGLIEFDLSTLPAGATITSATLELYDSGPDLVTAGTEIGIHRVTTDWVEGTGVQTGTSPADGASWNRHDGVSFWTTPGGDYDPTAVDTSPVPDVSARWHQFDATTLVAGWLRGDFPNNGLLIRATSGTLTKSHIESSDHTTPSERPKLTINFNCPCGVSCVASPGGAPGAGTSLLLAVGDAATLATQDSAKKTLIESWGYTVSLIDDDASQAEFDTATATAEVAYVSATVWDTKLSTKLVNAPIGVISEVPPLVDDFGFSSTRGSGSLTQIDVTDNSHYITSEYPVGLLTIFSSTQSSHHLTGSLAPDLIALSGTSGGAPTLAALDLAASLSNGGTAAGRRVKLPWGDTAFDHSLMNADGETMMKRAIEWGAGAGSVAATGPIAHWKLDDATGAIAIDFEGGHDGTLVNGPAWDTGVLGGAISFDGSDDYIDMTSDAALDDVFDGGATVTAWINPTTWGENNYGRILDKDDGLTTPGNGWAIEFDGTNRWLLLQKGFSTAGGEWSVPTDAVSLNTWQHVGIVYDSSAASNDPVIYLNGVAQTLAERRTPSGSSSSDAALMLRLGNYSLGTSRTFKGSIDDVRIYDRMLDAAEIVALAVGGGGASALYVETYEVWTPTVGAEWQVQDLSGFGVPSNAVVEVAITNGNPNFERSAGVRAVGSVIDRRLELTEAEAGGEDVVVMHVQTDSNSQIEHYAYTAGTELRFVLLGYWTAGTYVERFDVFTAGVSGSWVDRSLAPYGVAPDSVAEIVMTNKNQSLEREAGVRTPGSGLNNRRVDIQEAENGGVDGATMMVVADGSSNAAIQVAAEADADVDFYLVGYWSSPPGTYIEAAGPIVDPNSPDGAWTGGDFSASGAPANSTVQIAVMNGSSGREANLGVREVGSSQERWLDLREAESGGMDIAVWHVNFDGSSAIEWYDERTSEAHEFRVLGWWQ